MSREVSLKVEVKEEPVDDFSSNFQGFTNMKLKKEEPEEYNPEHESCPVETPNSSVNSSTLLPCANSTPLPCANLTNKKICPQQLESTKNSLPNSSLLEALLEHEHFTTENNNTSKRKNPEPDDFAGNHKSENVENIRHFPPPKKRSRFAVRNIHQHENFRRTNSSTNTSYTKKKEYASVCRHFYFFNYETFQCPSSSHQTSIPNKAHCPSFG